MRCRVELKLNFLYVTKAFLTKLAHKYQIFIKRRRIYWERFLKEDLRIAAELKRGKTKKLGKG